MMPSPVRARAVSTWSLSSEPSFRLICIPYAGGGVSTYHKWAESLPRGVEVCALQLPGRDTQFRVPPFRRVDALVESLAGALDPWLDLPYALFGHSMGGMIGHELIRALQALGKPGPKHFFTSACRAPGRPIGRWPMHGLAEESFIRELRARYDGIPDAVLQDKELLKHFIPLLRADLEMVETFRDSGGGKFDFPITAFGGQEDREVALEDLEPWVERTSGRFDLHMIAGNHFFVNTARAEVLRVVGGHLAVQLAG